jgi:outer membrane biosynthesis protein TonB
MPSEKAGAGFAIVTAGLLSCAPKPEPEWQPPQWPPSGAQEAQPTFTAAAPLADSGDLRSGDRPDATATCPDKCTGQATPELGRALQLRAGWSRHCYNLALRADPALEGAIRIQVRVAGDGSVCDAKVMESNVPEDMTACSLKVFSGATYPTFRGDCVVAVVPLRLLHQRPDAAIGGASADGLDAASSVAPRLLEAASTDAEVEVGVPPRGGLDPAAIRRVVVAHRGALQACYELEARKDPTLRGGVTAAFTISSSGTVTSALMAGSTIHNERVEGCILRQVRSWTFPSSEGVSQATFPFQFGIAR